MLQPQGYPKELSDFLTKNSDLVINESFVAVLMRAPNHSLWESMGVWTTCMMSGNSVHLDHLAMSLSATVYEGYKKFGEKLLVNSINECAWNRSLSKRQALDDAQVLNDQTVTVESPQRQHRL